MGVRLAPTRLISLIGVAYFFSFTRCRTYVTARRLNSIQRATGEWDVSIRGGFWMNASRIFPSVRSSDDPSPLTNSIWKSKSKDEMVDEMIPFVKRRPWGASLDCILSLASDGTFVLTPKFVQTSNRGKEEYETTNHDISIHAKEKKVTANGVLDLRGSWNILANPYCVTDRFYDQVTLKSYPHEKVLAVPGNRKMKATEKQILQKREFVLNCRLQRHRMTHGTLVCKGRDVPWWKHFLRPVVGSFSAMRSSFKPKHEGWIDKEQFGYSPD